MRVVAIDVEQGHREAIGLPGQHAFQRNDLGPQPGVYRGLGPHVQRGGEQRAGVDGADLIERPAGAIRPGRRRPDRRLHLSEPDLAHVPDSGGAQILPGTEVMLRGPARHPGPGRHARHGRPCPAGLGKRGHGGLQQAIVGGAAAVLFEHDGHRSIVPHNAARKKQHRCLFSPGPRGHTCPAGR